MSNGFKTNAPLKDVAAFSNKRVFEKIIYNWRQKTEKERHGILSIEVDYLIRQNPEYELQGFSKPVENKDGSQLYMIYLQKKKK